GLVARRSLLVGLVALDLRLDVCHAWKLSFRDGWMCRKQEEGCCSTVVRDEPTRKPRTNSTRSEKKPSRAAVVEACAYGKLTLSTRRSHPWRMRLPEPS